MGILTDLRERRLTQIVISYVIAGWGVLQVADHFVDRNVVPEFVYQLTLIWYVVGILAAVLIGWHHGEGEKGAQKVPHSEIALLIMLLLSAAALSASPLSKHLAGVRKLAAAESGLEMSRIGVLYFDDVSRGRPQQHLAAGLTEALIDELRQVRTLDVISKNGVAQFRDRDIELDSIVRALQAGTLVDGTVEQVGDRVRVDIRLLEGRSGAAIQRASFERPAGNPLAIRDELVEETSRLLREWLGQEIRLRATAEGTESPRAWALLQ